MIDLRMVADDHGYMQLQSRGFCVQRGWTEWKSVPIVHDPSQFVAGVEVFDAKTSGAKPDGGLTAAQVAKIVKKLEDKRDECDKAAIASNNERFRDSQNGWSDGISNCLLFIRSELSPQPDEPSVDQDEPDHPNVEDWVDATPEHIMMVYNGEVLKARFKQEASNPNWVCTDVDGYDLTLRGWDRGSFIDSAGEPWDLCQVYCKRS
jgi:hypothetical protein